MILLNGCLFTHIPKTGGTSIRTAMASDKRAVMLTTITDYLAEDVRVNQYEPHAKISQVESAFGVLLEQVWKFTFVRNPWDRYASCFFYRKDKRSFPEFLSDIISRGFTMSKYLKNVEYQFIGKMETMQQDWNFVASQLGIKPKPLPKLNVSVRNDCGHYRDMYTPNEVELVRNHEQLLLSQFPSYEF